MTLRSPLAIERIERSLPQAAGIEPGDLAPCLVQPEIWVRGHAWYPPAPGAPSMRVRFVVARDGTALLRKTVEIPIQQDSFVPPHLHALAPLARTWPVRARLLGAFDWTNLDRSPIELPDTFDWSYFQAAPTDQRLEPLRGDEWLRLESMHATMLKFDTQLPSASCAVMMFGKMDPFRLGVPLRIGLDTLQIDVDHGLCALVFRGHLPLPTNVALEDLQFVAALGLSDRPLPKLEPRWTPQAPVAGPVQSPPSVAETFVFDEARLQAFAAKEPLPFHAASSRFPSSMLPPKPASSAPHPHGSSGDTFMLDESTLRAHADEDALPFHESAVQRVEQEKALPFRESSSVSRSPSANLQPPDEPSYLPASSLGLDAPLAKVQSLPSTSARPAQDAGSTFMLTDEMLAQLEGSTATPFAGGEPLPEREETLDVLAALPFQPATADGGVALSNTTTKNLSLGALFLAAMDVARQTGQPNGRNAAQ